MDKIFGRQVELLGKDGAASAGPPAAAKVIGLLFASSNAETSHFVERVAGACTKLLEHGKVLYIIYIPLDADDATARAAMSAHFVVLPQVHAPLRDKVWSEQQLSSSPSLVLFDASGGLITKNGMKVLREDPQCTKYPWVPQSLESLLGDILIQRDGKEASRRDVLAGKHVGLLFVAQWSRPSLQMIEKLYRTFASIRQQRSDFVVVVVSADKTEEEFRDTLAMMQESWYAKPYSSSAYTDVSGLFGVHSVPTLVVVMVLKLSRKLRTPLQGAGQERDN
jgi:alkanesulfonate monooxygenase SsuD/methylene tetrahydromethanopterin reductase-like flavin-dependent oxidoreductase (luciferase family)